jgi:hypothetical protein
VDPAAGGHRALREAVMRSHATVVALLLAGGGAALLSGAPGTGPMA